MEENVSVPGRSARIESIPVAVPSNARLDAIDFLRGVAMVVMALDHTRDFFSCYRFDPLDLTQTHALLFMTRWVTHFCAPVFVFLAGTGAFLSTTRGKTKPVLAKFLLTRGLWLILLEFTVIRFGWLFNLDYTLSFGQVIWAIGVSMIALSALVFLPARTVAMFGAAVIALHNLLDGITPSQLGVFGWPWQIIHSGGVIIFPPNYYYIALYPLIPWVGVMAAGYGFGMILLKDEHTKRRMLLMLGLGMIIAFAVIRAVNIYGDPHHWSPQKNFLYTFFSFIKCEKYPPSLLYLLMTLGPAIALIPLLEKIGGWPAKVFTTFGRVPLFYYVLHIYLIHVLAIAAAYFSVHRVGFLFSNNPPGTWSTPFGYKLGIVYLVWLVVVGSLYPACRWFAAVKKRRKEAWLSYI